MKIGNNSRRRGKKIRRSGQKIRKKERRKVERYDIQKGWNEEEYSKEKKTGRIERDKEQPIELLMLICQGQKGTRGCT